MLTTENVGRFINQQNTEQPTSCEIYFIVVPTAQTAKKFHFEVNIVLNYFFPPIKWYKLKLNCAASNRISWLVHFS